MTPHHSASQGRQRKVEGPARRRSPSDNRVLVELIDERIEPQQHFPDRYLHPHVRWGLRLVDLLHAVTSILLSFVEAQIGLMQKRLRCQF